jgi:hypothetical protein
VWYYGSITSTVGNLKIGQTPCGCSKIPRYTEIQNRIRSEKRAETLNHIFHGWSGVYRGTSTRLRLEDPVSGVCWDTTTLTNYLRQLSNNPIERYKSTPHMSEDVIKRIRQSGFYDGYEFWLDEEDRDYVLYTCPLCSNDMYVQAGVCSGVFRTLRQTAYKGSKSCRCAYAYRWTKEQREYHIESICSEEDLTFLGWVDENDTSSASYIRWVCKKGHTKTTILGSFLSGRRCSDCFKTEGVTYGYYSERVLEKDTLYIISFKDEYLKVGRTFNIKNRLKSLARSAKCTVDDLKILKILSGVHQDVFNTEQWIHTELESRGFSYQTDWTTESFDLDSLNCLEFLLPYSPLTIIG